MIEQLNNICIQDEVHIDKSSITVDGEKAVAFIDKVSLDDLELIEGECVNHNINQVDELNAYFLEDKLCEGLYARALTIPKGVFLTGRIHKRNYIDMVISGDVTVKSFLSDGTVENTERISSFRFFEGKAGRKRVLFTHEDTLWITVDPTQASKHEDLEGDITVSQMSDYFDLLGVGV